MKWLLVLTAVFALAASAADVTGTWKATAEGPNGTMERTFVFKVDGSKLTGETTSSIFGKSTILEGKVDGDNLSFTIVVKFQDNEMKLNCKGKVSGNELQNGVGMWEALCGCAYRKSHPSQAASEHGPWVAKGLPGIRWSRGRAVWFQCAARRRTHSAQTSRSQAQKS